MGLSRQEFWSRLTCSSPGDLPDPRIEPATLKPTCIGKRVLYHYQHLGNPRKGGQNEGNYSFPNKALRNLRKQKKKKKKGGWWEKLPPGNSGLNAKDSRENVSRRTLTTRSSNSKTRTLSPMDSRKVGNWEEDSENFRS